MVGNPEHRRQPEQLDPFMSGGGHYMVQYVGNRGRWLPTTSVEQYGATMASWFGVNSAELDQVFPSLVNFPTSNLGFMK